MASNPSGYDRSYYERNKDRLLARRKMRYQRDEEYRAAALDRRKEQATRTKEKNAEKPRIKKAATAGKKMRVVISTGETVVLVMFSVGQLAFRLGVSIATIRKWETENVLPPALFRSEGGHRLYSEDQATIIRDTHNEFREKNPVWRLTDDFVKQLHARLNLLDTGADMARRKALAGV